MIRPRHLYGTLVLIVTAIGCGGRSPLEPATSTAGDAASDGIAIGVRVDGGGEGARADAASPGDAAAAADVRSFDGPPRLDASAPRLDGSADLPPRDGGAAEAGAMATLVAVDVTPALTTLAAGTTERLVATGRFSDGSTRDLTTAATWTSSAPAVAAVASGNVRAISPGSSVVQAIAMGRVARVLVRVTAATIASLAIHPDDGRVPVGGRLAVRATGLLSDGSKQDVTATAAWAVSDPAVATVTGGAVMGLQAGTTTVTAAFGGSSATGTLTVTAAPLVALAVTPASAILPPGASARFQATGVHADGTMADLSGVVSWETSDRSVLRVAQGGLATAIGRGTAAVTARSGALVGTALVTIPRADLTSIRVTPAIAGVPLGTTQAFQATGTFSDGGTADLTTAVAWSTDGEIASVSNAPGSQGVLTALARRATAVVATLGRQSGLAAVNVTDPTVLALAVGPASATVARGRAAAFTATATYSDGLQRDVTQVATWASAAPAVARVANADGAAGQVRGAEEGTTRITAAFGGKSDAATISVKAAAVVRLVVAPAMATLPVGLRQTFTATAVHADGSMADVTAQVLWSTDSESVATIANALPFRGQSTAVGAGGTTVRARLDGAEGAASLAVVPMGWVDSTTLTCSDPGVGRPGCPGR